MKKLLLIVCIVSSGFGMVSNRVIPQNSKEKGTIVEPLKVHLPRTV